MILTLTPNPALDVTYTVDATRAHHEHRVREVHTAPGGKGVNVARVLAALGDDVAVTGPLGGASGSQLRELLGAAGGVDQRWIPVRGTTRRTLTVVDTAGATGFNEPGPTITDEECAVLGERITAHLEDLDVLTVNGSLPPGLDGEALAPILRSARAADVPVLVDTSGPALATLAAAGATVLKPNAAEAQQATGEDDPLHAARALLALGPQSVLCSLGGDGMLAVTAGTALHGRLAEPLHGNPTGAGDAAVAALARHLARGADLTDPDELADMLRQAIGLSASAVTRPLAGQVDPDLAASLRATVTIEEIR